jgi:hypothetical protein
MHDYRATIVRRAHTRMTRERLLYDVYTHARHAHTRMTREQLLYDMHTHA